MSTLLLIFVMIFVVAPIAKAYADRLSRGAQPGARIADAEMARLKEEVDRLALDVSRLQDEQSFMVRLLTDGERRKLEDGRPTGE